MASVVNSCASVHDVINCYMKHAQASFAVQVTIVYLLQCHRADVTMSTHEIDNNYPVQQAVRVHACDVRYQAETNM